MFDEENPTTLEGRVSKATWRIPHVYFEIEVETADGQTVTWILENGSVSLLAQSGWSKDSKKVDDLIMVTVNPHINDAKKYADHLPGTGRND